VEEVTVESKLKDTNKNSVIKDSNGYYKVSLGALNTYNDNGIFYKIDDLNGLLNNEKSIIGSRLKMGIVRCEYKHPDFTGLNGQELVNRIINIDLDRVCGHLKSVSFIKTGKTEKGWERYPIYIVHGWIKPSGPYAKYLEEALENPDENVSMSIRSAVNEITVGNTVVRTILDISTWDFVHEQGYKIANQWYAAGIENKVIDSGVVCLDDKCLIKLKSVKPGIESYEDKKRLAASLEKEMKKNKIFNW